MVSTLETEETAHHARNDPGHPRISVPGRLVFKLGFGFRIQGLG